MKKVFRQMLAGLLGVLLCALISGCAIGEYRIFDTYEDEDSGQHFMGFGEIGPSGGEAGVKDGDTAAAESNDGQENENNYDPESIIGTTLKRGWTSADHAILRGKNVSVKENSPLFSIDLKQKKEVIISCDVVLDEGDYQLVYVGPDGTERILQDGKEIRSEEKLLFPQGKNEISILSDSVVFKEIDISIAGIQASDF